jgi:LysR substrate binding domain
VPVAAEHGAQQGLEVVLGCCEQRGTEYANRVLVRVWVRARRLRGMIISNAVRASLTVGIASDRMAGPERRPSGATAAGCSWQRGAGLLAPVLRAWRRRHPDVHLALTELTSADALADAVASGQADIAIGPRPSRWDGPVSVIGHEEIPAQC